MTIEKLARKAKLSEDFVRKILAEEHLSKKFPFRGKGWTVTLTDESYTLVSSIAKILKVSAASVVMVAANTTLEELGK